MYSVLFLYSNCENQFGIQFSACKADLLKFEFKEVEEIIHIYDETREMLMKHFNWYLLKLSL